MKQGIGDEPKLAKRPRFLHVLYERREMLRRSLKFRHGSFALGLKKESSKRDGDEDRESITRADQDSPPKLQRRKSKTMAALLSRRTISFKETRQPEERSNKRIDELNPRKMRWRNTCPPEQSSSQETLEVEGRNTGANPIASGDKPVLSRVRSRNSSALQRRLSQRRSLAQENRHSLSNQSSNNATSKRQHVQVSLDNVFQCHETLELFSRFCRARKVEEGVKFWRDVEAFQNMDWKNRGVLDLDHDAVQTPNSHDGSDHVLDNARELANEILAKYLKDDSPQQVCLDSDMVTDLIHRIEVEEDIAQDMFLNAQQVIFDDMENGLFQEFISSLCDEEVILVYEKIVCAEDVEINLN